MKLDKLGKNIMDNQKKNIALMGHMGSGKSVLGKLISKNSILIMLTAIN